MAVGGAWTGALDISLAARRIISIPSQLGCRVGCTFCPSSQSPLARNLTAEEMLRIVVECLVSQPADGRPLELSFTGEGEPALNHRQCAEVCEWLPSLSRDFDSVRYCFSGLAADRLLGRLEGGPFPMRLQCSLHAARDDVRTRLVPRSIPVRAIEAALTANASRFRSIELNVALQAGVNDADADLQALIAWGDPAWPILLNPLLADGQEVVAPCTDGWQARLQAAGRVVKRYSRIAAEISRGGVFPLLTVKNTR